MVRLLATLPNESLPNFDPLVIQQETHRLPSRPVNKPTSTILKPHDQMLEYCSQRQARKLPCQRAHPGAFLYTVHAYPDLAVRAERLHIDVLVNTVSAIFGAEDITHEEGGEDPGRIEGAVVEIVADDKVGVFEAGNAAGVRLKGLCHCGVSRCDLNRISARGCGIVAFADFVGRRRCKTDSAHQSSIAVDESFRQWHELRHAVVQGKIIAEYIDRPDHDAERDISLFRRLDYNCPSGKNHAEVDAPEHCVIFVVVGEIVLKVVEAEPGLTGFEHVDFWVVVHFQVESGGLRGIWGGGTAVRYVSSRRMIAKSNGRSLRLT